MLKSGYSLITTTRSTYTLGVPLKLNFLIVITEVSIIHDNLNLIKRAHNELTMIKLVKEKVIGEQ